MRARIGLALDHRQRRARERQRLFRRRAGGEGRGEPRLQAGAEPAILVGGGISEGRERLAQGVDQLAADLGEHVLAPLPERRSSEQPRIPEDAGPIAGPAEHLAAAGELAGLRQRPPERELDLRDLAPVDARGDGRGERPLEQRDRLLVRQPRARQPGRRPGRPDRLERIAGR